MRFCLVEAVPLSTADMLYIIATRLDREDFSYQRDYGKA